MHTYIDLHTHSTASDGTCTPEELITLALQQTEEDSFVILALTDHDTTAGIPSFLSAASHHQDRICAIPGIEISSDYHGIEIHIIGLNIDPSCAVLNQQMELSRQSRDGRNTAILAKLQEHGISVSLKDNKPEKPDETIGRPHIARALLNAGYVSSIKEAFDLYLAEGRSCFIKRKMPSVTEAVNLIQQSGGIPILAHPMIYHKLSSSDLHQLTGELKAAGLKGIEGYYSTYSEAEESYVADLAKQHALLLSGGSDFHGKNKPDISLFSGKGTLQIPPSVFHALFSENITLPPM